MTGRESWLLVALLGLAAAGCLLARVVNRQGDGRRASSVSLLIVLRDAAPWVEGLVRELVRLHSPWVRELVVVDDGSGDDTPLILERLRPYAPWLKVVLRRPGQASATELGLASCSSPLVLMAHPRLADAPRVMLRAVRPWLACADTPLEEKQPGQ